MKKTNIITLSHDYQMDKSQVLGKGSTGQVYLGKQIATGLPVAVKLIRLETIDNEVTEYLLRMEKAALTALNHQNILKGLKIIENSSKCYIITEYCNGGTLKQLIKKQGTLNEEKSIEILKDLLKGYSVLARRKIVHRDLKPANVMLHNMAPKIIDFGYCEIEGYEKPSLQYNVGSPSYMAPESFQQNIYNEKTEIWALGIILYECLMGKTFDDGKHMSQVYKALKKFGIPFGKEISDKCRKIIIWCLQFSPEKRPTALELINFLTQKKSNEPEFFILEKNRKKANSHFTSAVSFESNQLLTKRKIPVVQKRASGFYQPEQKVVNTQAQTLKRKDSIKEHAKVIMEGVERKLSRNSSKSKENFGAIVQQTVNTKIENFNSQARDRVNSKDIIKYEYGLNRDVFFKTEKFFTGQSIQNKFPSHHDSAFNSGLTSPRQLERKQTKKLLFTNIANKNPESAKQRISSKASNGPQVYCGQNYFDVNPSIHYRYSVHPQYKTSNDRKIMPRNQNHISTTYIHNEPFTQTTSHPFQYYQLKPSMIKQSCNFLQPNQNPTAVFINRERPSSSIYQLNKFLEDKQKPLSIFRSGVTMAQKTCR